MTVHFQWTAFVLRAILNVPEDRTPLKAGSQTYPKKTLSL